MQELTEQQKQLMKALQEHGKNVRISAISKPYTRNCPVVATYSLPSTKYGVHPYNIGSVQVQTKPAQPDFISIQWYRSLIGTVSMPVECITFTGLDLEVERWERATKSRRARRVKVYKPLFECYQTQEQAFSPRTAITEERYEDLYEEARPIWLNTTKLDTGYGRITRSKKSMTRQIKAFAISEACGSAKDTLVLTVCYIEIYKRWKKDMGWVKAKPEAYFMQDMCVYTHENKGILETSTHFNKTGYIGRAYYKSKR